MHEVDDFRRLLAATRPLHPARLECLRTAAPPSLVKPVVLAGLASLIAVVVTIAVAWPALAGAWMRHISPRAVDRLPSPNTIAIATPTSAHASRTLLELQAGFTPLLPTFVPAGCVRRQEVAVPAPANAVTVTYSCGLTFTEQTIRQEEPLVGPASTQPLLINGQPAVYVQGGWIQDIGQSQPHWEPGLNQQLFWEQDGLFIHILAPPAEATTRMVGSGSQTVTVRPANVLPKADLLRIAASLRPAGQSAP